MSATILPFPVRKRGMPSARDLATLEDGRDHLYRDLVKYDPQTRRYAEDAITYLHTTGVLPDYLEPEVVTLVFQLLDEHSRSGVS